MDNQTTSHSELEAIKSEIITELGNSKNSKNLPWGNTAVSVILGALALVSVAQMMASVSIFNKLKTGEVNASTGVPQNSSIQSQPDMVGGC